MKLGKITSKNPAITCSDTSDHFREKAATAATLKKRKTQHVQAICVRGQKLFVLKFMNCNGNFMENSRTFYSRMIHKKPAGTRGFQFRVRVGSGFTRVQKIAFGSGRVIHFRVGFSGFRVPVATLLHILINR